MADLCCPNCGRVLRSFEPPGFCEVCGTPVKTGPPPQSPLAPPTREAKSANSLLYVWDVVALLIGVMVRRAGADFIQALLVVVVLVSVPHAIQIFWLKAARPAGRRIRDEGIVSVGKAAYERFVKPILYGKQGASPKK